MKNSLLWIVIALAAAGAHAADVPSDAGVAAVDALGRLNGQSLACSETAISARAKELMLKHAPRTSRYGTAFEQATQQGFAEQVKSAACPAAAELSRRLDDAAARLAQTLPPLQ
jgi:hypothetical protein